MKTGVGRLAGGLPGYSKSGEMEKFILIGFLLLQFSNFISVDNTHKLKKILVK